MNLAIFQLRFHNATHYATTLFTHFPVAITLYHSSSFKLTRYSKKMQMVEKMKSGDYCQSRKWSFFFSSLLLPC